MEIEIKTLQQGYSFQMHCEKDYTVQELKNKISERKDLTQEYDSRWIKLLCDGIVMENDKYLQDYNVTSESNILLIKQPVGSVPPPKRKPLPPWNSKGGLSSLLSIDAFNDPFGTSPFSQARMIEPKIRLQEPRNRETFLEARGPRHHDSFMPSLEQFGNNQFLTANLGAQPNQFTAVKPLTVSSPFSENALSTAQLGSIPSASASPLVPPMAVRRKKITNVAGDRYLKSLMDVGFTRKQSKKALKTTGYDFQMALDILTSQSNSAKPEECPLPSIEARRTAKGSIVRKSIVREPSPEPSSDSDSESETEVDFSFDQPPVSADRIQEFSRQLRNDPDQLRQLKERMKHSNPEIAHMIDNNPDQFLNMVENMRAGNGGESSSNHVPNTATGAARQSVEVRLSSREQEAINRLEAMGFERNTVIEAFLCCDRNEEMAANYLINVLG